MPILGGRDNGRYTHAASDNEDRSATDGCNLPALPVHHGLPRLLLYGARFCSSPSLPSATSRGGPQPTRRREAVSTTIRPLPAPTPTESPYSMKGQYRYCPDL